MSRPSKTKTVIDGAPRVTVARAHRILIDSALAQLNERIEQAYTQGIGVIVFAGGKPLRLAIELTDARTGERLRDGLEAHQEEPQSQDGEADAAPEATSEVTTAATNAHRRETRSGDRLHGRNRKEDR